jgi:hypothetical protein
VAKVRRRPEVEPELGRQSAEEPIRPHEAFEIRLADLELRPGKSIAAVGFRNRSLREHLGRFRSSQVSRLLKRLRLHGIIKKVGKTYKYYLTEIGRHVAVAGLTLKSLFLIPEFATAALAH